MRTIDFLFPWRPTFRRLELQKRWWHRLAVVLFFGALVPWFLFSWILGDQANSPFNSFQNNIQYWAILSPPPKGFVTDQDVDPITAPPDSNSFEHGKISVPVPQQTGIDSNEIRKTVEMPDGKTETYSANTSDDAIKAEWQHKLNMAGRRAVLLGLGIAVLVTVILSYLLQAGYRAVLYVIYGAKAGIASDSPGA